MGGFNLKIPSETPRRFLVLLYRQWESIDVMGPLEALNTLSRNVADDTEPFRLDIVAPHGQPASTAPRQGQGTLVNQQIIPTHGYDDSKDAEILAGAPEADVLIIPGGLGPPPDERPGVVRFIKEYYAKYLEGKDDRYLFTVCTGSGLAAEAGCLDGVYATTNKSAFKWVADRGPKTYWVAHARWVDQGNIWTTSGVSAGTDGFLAWMRKVYGDKAADEVAKGMEYNLVKTPENDPFAGMYGLGADGDIPNRKGGPMEKYKSG